MVIGEVLVQKGKLSREELDRVLQEKDPSERVGEAIVRLGLAEEDDVFRCLAEQAQLPFLEITELDPDSELLSKVNVKTIFRRRILPLDDHNGTVRIAIADPLDLEVLDELRLLLKTEVTAVVARPSEIDRLIKKHYGVGAEEVDNMVGASRDEIQVVREEDDFGEELVKMAEDAGLVKFVNQVLTEAVRDRASDIHIEPMEEELRIRYRIDGVLHRVPVPSEVSRFQSAIISRIKIMSNLNIAERRLPQDGRIKLKMLGKEIDVRVSIIPNVWGEGICLRLLDRANMDITLEQLGMPPKVLQQFHSLLKEPHGIFLVTGPTGSGKTTSLYAGLDKINSTEDKIITVEDPVEYQLSGIKQIQINPKVGLTFASGLRAILRHDPDIIMIGEIRDLETSEIAVQAALTGHLVFSTLHTNDAPSAITRLIDMGVEPFLVASTVEGLMAQRLVRKVCVRCSEEHPIPLADHEEGIVPEDIKTYQSGKGCDHCRGTGYSGRQGVFELVVVDDKIRDMILHREGANRIKKYCIEKGMVSLREQGWDCVRSGITTPEEIVRITKADKF